jgi:hypothetical protein
LPGIELQVSSDAWYQVAFANFTDPKRAEQLGAVGKLFPGMLLARINGQDIVGMTLAAVEARLEQRTCKLQFFGAKSLVLGRYKALGLAGLDKKDRTRLATEGSHIALAGFWNIFGSQVLRFHCPVKRTQGSGFACIEADLLMKDVTLALAVTVPGLQHVTRCVRLKGYWESGGIPYWESGGITVRTRPLEVGGVSIPHISALSTEGPQDTASYKSWRCWWNAADCALKEIQAQTHFSSNGKTALTSRKQETAIATLLKDAGIREHPAGDWANNNASQVIHVECSNWWTTCELDYLVTFYDIKR